MDDKEGKTESKSIEKTKQIKLFQKRTNTEGNFDVQLLLSFHKSPTRGHGK